MTPQNREELGRALVILTHAIRKMGELSYKHFDSDPELVRDIGALQESSYGYIRIIRDRYGLREFYRPLPVPGTMDEILYRRFSVRDANRVDRYDTIRDAWFGYDAPGQWCDQHSSKLPCSKCDESNRLD
jgi:hypothetical protein